MDGGATTVLLYGLDKRDKVINSVATSNHQPIL